MSSGETIGLQSYYSEDKTYLEEDFNATKLLSSIAKPAQISTFCGRVLALEADKGSMKVCLQGISDVDGDTIRLKIEHNFLKEDAPPFTPIVGSYLIAHNLKVISNGNSVLLETTAVSRLVYFSEKICFFHGPDYLVGRPVDFTEIHMNQVTSEEAKLWVWIRRTPLALKKPLTITKLNCFADMSEFLNDIKYHTELKFVELDPEKEVDGNIKRRKVYSEWRTTLFPIYYLKNEAISVRSGYTTFGIIRRVVMTGDGNMFICLADPSFPENEIVLSLTVNDFGPGSLGSTSYQEGDLVVVDITRLIKGQANESNNELFNDYCQNENGSKEKTIYYSVNGNKLFTKWNTTIYHMKPPYSYNSWYGLRGVKSFSTSPKLVEPVKRLALQQVITKLQNVYTPLSLNYRNPMFSICVRILAWPKNLNAHDITLAVTDYTANPLFPQYSTLVEKKVANMQPYGIISLFIPGDLKYEVFHEKVKEAECIIFDSVEIIQSQNGNGLFYMKINPNLCHKTGDFCRPAPKGSIPYQSYCKQRDNFHLENQIPNTQALDNVPSNASDPILPIENKKSTMITNFDDDEDDDDIPPKPIQYVASNQNLENSPPTILTPPTALSTPSNTSIPVTVSKSEDLPRIALEPVTKLKPTAPLLPASFPSLQKVSVTQNGRLGIYEPEVLSKEKRSYIPELSIEPMKMPIKQASVLENLDCSQEINRIPEASPKRDLTSLHTIANQSYGSRNSSQSEPSIQQINSLEPITGGESEEDDGTDTDLNMNDKATIKLCDNVFCHSSQDITTIPSIIENGVEFGQTFKIIARIDQITPGKVRHFVTTDGEIHFTLVISDITFSDKLEVEFWSKLGNAQPFLGMKTSTMIANPAIILDRLKTLKSDINTNIWFPLCIKVVPLSDATQNEVKFLGCETQILY